MSSFNALDIAVQRNITRLTIELFLYDLGERHGSPAPWQMALADHAIAAYHNGELDLALGYISVAEKPAHPRTLLASSTAGAAELSLRKLWSRLVTLASGPSPAREGLIEV
jgi:hypothetical protein